MAYLRPLPSCSKCDRPATEVLCNDRNAPMGRYCSRHAKSALRKARAKKEARDG